jgi:hypothetical protein
MAEVGRLGGLRAPMTKLRKATRADDELRDRARQVLADAMDGKTVDRGQLAAAKSLFSYRSDVPTARERDHPRRGGPKIITLADLVDEAVQHGLVVAERGGAILVDGRRVERVDPTLSRSHREVDSRIAARPASPDDLGALVGDQQPEYDEGTAAKLLRRYGKGS